jgi:signal transduction histidine kinase
MGISSFVVESGPQTSAPTERFAQISYRKTAPEPFWFNSATNNGTTSLLPHLGLFLKGLNAGYLKVDRQYIVREGNSVLFEWLGASEERVIGRHFSEIAPGSPLRILRKAVEKRVFTDCELRSYSRPDRWLDLHVYPAEDGAVLFFRDVTQEKVCIRDATRMRALLNASLDTLSAHVAILSKTGEVVASNLSSHQTGTGGQVLALDCVTSHDGPFGTETEARKVRSALDAVLTGRRQAARVSYTRRFGEEMRWFQLSAARFRCEGEPYVTVVNEDITSLKEAEAALGELGERLLATQEDERQRIAGELHDSTVQHLVAIGLNAMRIKSQAGVAGETLGLLQEIEDLLEEASKELRTFTYLLHPPRLDDDGLQIALRRYVDGFSRRTGIEARLRISRAADTVPTGLRRALFRIVQEGLTSVHRHAAASRVAVELRCITDRLHLVVSDDGKGMGDQLPGGRRARCRLPDSGVGLSSIRARLRQFGGDLQMLSGACGTKLHAVVPFVAPAPLGRARRAVKAASELGQR